MQKTAKLKITTTRKRTVNITVSAHRAFCAACGKEVQALTCREAAEFLETGEENVEGFIAAERIHAIRTVTGGLLICKNSLVS